MATGHENLIPAKLGEVRNPNGRPVGSRNRSTIYREWLEMNNANGESNLTSVMRALILKASEGDIPAIKEIMDGSYGKIADKSDVNLKADVAVNDVTQKVLNQIPTEQLEAILMAEK